MRIFNKLAILLVALGLFIPAATFAAASPSLGAAATYGILSTTYTNSSPGTTVNGDIGFTTGPTVTPMGVHANFGSAAPFTTAVADKGTALAALNAQPCTFTFAPGAVDFATDTTHGAMGVYTPGVYCISSLVTSASIGASGITLNGAGTYIFRINGSLRTVPASTVTLTNGASACDVFWTAVDNAVTSSLGANSTFSGTLMDTMRLDVQVNVTWTGRAMLDGTVNTNVDDTLTVPNTCTPPVPPAPTTATLHVIKHVINDGGGTSVASAFSLHVKGSTSMGMTDVAGSPAPGTEAPGISYTLATGTYAVSEDSFVGYSSTFSGDCDANGTITLAGGDDKTCTVTNDDVAPALPPVVVPPVVVPPLTVPPVVVNPPVVPPAVVVPPVLTTVAIKDPNAPNTGAGGNAPATLLLLVLSAMVALGGIVSLRRSAR